eukprot:gnl/MRDRNA2_/MRDRNA2_36563_c0_seq1.p1 gnl/MRDRNA2_/MRDRNA2_36563_c0~~gnl/MRDRNA2_/MRDRNA2_36563_c0_seq1.p1  ORF type:complete len:959 (+),score=181.01 gnl/MRDRNA2_/MRDRNA2_36563_c0_seq1:392-2878(+)
MAKACLRRGCYFFPLCRSCFELQVYAISRKLKDGTLDDDDDMPPRPGKNGKKVDPFAGVVNKSECAISVEGEIHLDVDLTKVDAAQQVHLTESLKQEMCRALRVRPQQVLCQPSLSGHMGAFQFGFVERDVAVKKEQISISESARLKMTTGFKKVRMMARLGVFKKVNDNYAGGKTAGPMPPLPAPGSDQCNELKYDSLSNPMELYNRFVDLISGKSGRRKIFQSDAFPILAGAHADSIRWTSVTVAPRSTGVKMLTEGRGKLLENDIDDELNRFMQAEGPTSNKQSEVMEHKGGRRGTVMPSSSEAETAKLRSVLQDLLCDRTAPDLHKKYEIEPSLAPAIFRDPPFARRNLSAFKAKQQRREQKHKEQWMSELQALGFTAMSAESRKSWPFHQMAWDDDEFAMQNALASTSMARKARDLDRKGHTVAHVAAIRAGPGIMETIVTHAPEIALDLQKVDSDGRTALHYAAIRGDPSVALVLAAALAEDSLSIPDHQNKDTPLILAARSSYVEIVQGLLELNAFTDPSNSRGLTALHESSAAGCSECCEALLVSQANPNAVDSLCRSPLHWAALRQHADVVQILLAANADTTLATTAGDTALMFAKRASPTPALCALEDGETPETAFSMVQQESPAPVVDRMWTKLPVNAFHITEFESQGAAPEVCKPTVTPRPKSSGGLSTTRRGRLWQTWKGAGVTVAPQGTSDISEESPVTALRGKSLLDKDGAVTPAVSLPDNKQAAKKGSTTSVTTLRLAGMKPTKGSKAVGSLGVRWRLWALDLEEGQPDKPVRSASKRRHSAAEGVAVACADLGGFFCPCCRQYVLEDHPQH